MSREAANDTNTVKRQLQERLAELRAAIESTAEDRKPVELDQQAVGRLSRMDSLQVQAMAQQAERLKAREIGRVEAALARIASGDFGYCASCGEEIGPRRLAVDPTIPTCIACASGDG